MLPVYEVPGDNPTSPPAVPEIVVAPVFVIVEPARTPYVLVDPWRIVGPTAEDDVGITMAALTAANSVMRLTRLTFTFLFTRMFVIFTQ